MKSVPVPPGQSSKPHAKSHTSMQACVEQFMSMATRLVACCGWAGNAREPPAKQNLDLIDGQHDAPHTLMLSG